MDVKPLEEKKVIKIRRGHNEGTIRKKKNGSWEARYTDGKKANGKQNQISICGTDLKEVKKQLIDVLDKKNKGTYIEPNKMTVAEWMQKWLREYVIPTKRISTASGYEDMINTHIIPNIGHKKLQDLSPDDVQNMINHIKTQIPYKAKFRIKKLEEKCAKKSTTTEDKLLYTQEIKELSKQTMSAKTVSNVVVMLSVSLKQAVNNGLINKNVASLVSKPKIERKEIDYLTMSEQLKFNTITVSHKLGFMFEFCLATGLRQSELLGLRWEDVDELLGQIKIRNTLMRRRDFDQEATTKTKIVKGKPKTDSGYREIPLPSAIIAKLKRHKAIQDEEETSAGTAWENTGYVFVNEIGKTLDPRKVLKVFHDLLKKAGLKRRGLHALRHTFATRAIEAGMDYKTLSEILGHKDVATTLKLYVHSDMDEKKKKMEKLNFLYNS